MTKTLGLAALGLLAFSLSMSTPCLAQDEGPIPDGARLKITYDGSMQGSVKVQDRSRDTKLNIGGFKLNVGGTRDVPVTAGYHLEVTYGVDGSFTATERQTSATRGANGAGTITGSRIGDTCNSVANDGRRFVAHCTMTVFEYDSNYTNPQQQEVKSHYATRRTALVDLAEVERQQETARIEAQKKAEEFQALLKSRPKASREQVQLLNDAIAEDSSSWILNRLKAGSLSDVVVMPNSTDGATIVRGNYSYTNETVGWAQARIDSNTIQCVEYWDAQGYCKPAKAKPTEAEIKEKQIKSGELIAKLHFTPTIEDVKNEYETSGTNYENNLKCMVYSSSSGITKSEVEKREGRTIIDPDVEIKHVTNGTSAYAKNNCKEPFHFKKTLSFWTIIDVDMEPGDVIFYSCSYTISREVGSAVDFFNPFAGFGSRSCSIGEYYKYADYSKFQKK